MLVRVRLEALTLILQINPGLFMEAEDCEVKKQPTLPSIDDSVARLNGRLYNLLANLKSASVGEQPENSTKEDDVSPIASPSIDSISSRLDNAHDLLETLERYMQRFHS